MRSAGRAADHAHLAITSGIFARLAHRHFQIVRLVRITPVGLLTRQRTGGYQTIFDQLSIEAGRGRVPRALDGLWACRRHFEVAAMNDQHCRMRARASARKHFPLQWGSIVRSRVNGVAEILALPVLLALAALALRYARENGKDEKEGNKTDRFFIGFG